MNLIIKVLKSDLYLSVIVIITLYVYGTSMD